MVPKPDAAPCPRLRVQLSAAEVCPAELWLASQHRLVLALAARQSQGNGGGGVLLQVRLSELRILREAHPP